MQEWRFRAWSARQSARRDADAAGGAGRCEKVSCEGPSRPSCALARPCVADGSDGAYAASVAFWRRVTADATWEERVASAAGTPYEVHPSLNERGIDCPLRIGERRLPYLVLGNATFGPRRRPPASLAEDLRAAGLSRVALVGDSLMRYVFAGVVGTYCGGEPIDPGCELTKKGGGRELRVGGASVAYLDGVHLDGVSAANLLGGHDPEETHVAYRVIAHENEAQKPGLTAAERAAELGSAVSVFWKRAAAGGVLRGSLASPTPCGYAGAVEYSRGAASDLFTLFTKGRARL